MNRGALIADHLSQERLDAALAETRAQGADWLLVGLTDPDIAAAIGIDALTTLPCHGITGLAWTTRNTLNWVDGWADVRAFDPAREALTPADGEKTTGATHQVARRLRPYLTDGYDWCQPLENLDMERTPEVLWLLPRNRLPEYCALAQAVISDKVVAEIWAFALRHQARSGIRPDPHALLTAWRERGLPGPGTAGATANAEAEADRLAEALAAHWASPPGPWIEVRLTHEWTLFFLDLRNHALPRYAVEVGADNDTFRTWFVRPGGGFQGPDLVELIDKFERSGVGPYHGDTAIAINRDAVKRGLPPYTEGWGTWKDT